MGPLLKGGQGSARTRATKPCGDPGDTGVRSTPYLFGGMVLGLAYAEAVAYAKLKQTQGHLY
jgi:hypothetical protein